MYECRKLGVVGHVSPFTLWQYNGTTLSLSEICKDGFFDPGVNLLRPGDVIILSAKDGTAMRVCVIENNTVKLRKLEA